METLGFYPLTLVLSYSSEFDGTCLLLTKKSYAKQYLPMFRVRDVVNVAQDRKHRHRFQLSPVQGPVILLQRLNTRRLRKRKKPNTPINGLTTSELANLEWGKAQEEKNNTPPYPAPLELLRFLDQRPKKKDSLLDIFASNGTTLLVSYPRSGNTLVRNLFERTTGLVTGSDTRPDRSLSKALAEAHNLVGEGVTQRAKTCLVKSHWPERIGCRIFPANRAILLIRNPFDAIDSYWNLNATNTHTETVTDEIYQQFDNVFEGLVENEIQVWCKFHRYWLDKKEFDNFPLLLVRFEDLIQNPAKELARMLEFVAGTQTLDDFWRQRIVHATASSQQEDSLGSYTPRMATKGIQSIGKSIRKGRYTQRLLDLIHSHAAVEAATCDRPEDDLLKRFGYDMQVQNFPENFVQGSAPALPSHDNAAVGSGSIRVNSGMFLVRPRDCPFGRAMRSWRLEHTNHDKEPFPRVPR